MRHAFARRHTALPCTALPFALLGALALAALDPATASAQPYTVHVVVESSDNPRSLDADARARLDSAADVRRALEDGKHRQLFLLVDAADDADLIVEVVWRGKSESTRTTTSTRVVPGTSPPLGSQQRITQDNLRVKLRVGTFEEDVWALDAGRTNWLGTVPHPSWRELAGRVAERAATWARVHEARLKHAAATRLRTADRVRPIGFRTWLPTVASRSKLAPLV